MWTMMHLVLAGLRLWLTGLDNACSRGTAVGVRHRSSDVGTAIYAGIHDCRMQKNAGCFRRSATPRFVYASASLLSSTIALL